MRVRRRIHGIGQPLIGLDLPKLAFQFVVLSDCSSKIISSKQMLIAVLFFATYNINPIFCHDLASYISKQSNARHIEPAQSNL